MSIFDSTPSPSFYRVRLIPLIRLQEIARNFRAQLLLAARSVPMPATPAPVVARRRSASKSLSDL